MPLVSRAGRLKPPAGLDAPAIRCERIHKAAPTTAAARATPPPTMAHRDHPARPPLRRPRATRPTREPSEAVEAATVSAGLALAGVDLVLAAIAAADARSLAMAATCEAPALADPADGCATAAG